MPRAHWYDLEAISGAHLRQQRRAASVAFLRAAASKQRQQFLQPGTEAEAWWIFVKVRNEVTEHFRCPLANVSGHQGARKWLSGT